MSYKMNFAQHIHQIVKKGALVLLVLVPFACQDFLDVSPQGDLTQASFPQSAADALLATNAAYSTLRNWSYHSGGYPILDIMSDDARKGSNPNDQLPTLGPYDTFTFNTTADGLDRWWAALYEGVKRANVVIERVPEIAMDQAKIDLYVAEARFLRGLFYFDLVRAWGGVPLITTLTPPLRAARASKADVYSLIEGDLSFAAGILPEKSEVATEDLGRATKGAAKALLARVYLFQGDFVKAESYALEVINSGQYDLEPDFNDAFGEAGEHGVESVFEIGARRNEGTNNGGNQYSNVQGIRGSPNRGWGFNRPSIDLMNSFENNDPRMDATIIFLGDVLGGVVTIGDGTTPDETRDANGNLIEMETYNQKVWTEGSNTITSWGHNRRIVRYADVLLMAAEALNENNKAAQALTYLNMLRARARGDNPSVLPDITVTDKSQLRDIIIEERRHELAMEGHRFWDLVRTGKAPEALGPLGFVAGKHELLPIPQTEVDLSEGTLGQNPEY
ncbi:MAG: RagB/SusD family nutrient uptake outer membrane protein [Imperialibacter sp.]|uniref:RagB/SusD family nutrient uptake outer membrane protein n=1 Tax=Imperialibacter sp. TaxID=2038411 RepID=UPI0032EF4581